MPLPRETAWKIRQMYEETDTKGNRKWSHARLAAYFQVSETTVYRIVNNFGRFGREPLPAVRSDAQMEADAKASLDTVMSATEKMARDVERQREINPDDLLDQLKGESNDGS